MLLERPGELVTRDELKRSLWPADTFVDFERCLNRAINKLREALGDDADSPRFIETLPRRGYRFVASVETSVRREAEVSGRNSLVPVAPDLPHKVGNGVSTVAIPPRQVLPWAAAAVLVMLAVILYWSPWRSSHVAADHAL